jgi:hypothetical protein
VLWRKRSIIFWRKRITPIIIKSQKKKKYIQLFINDLKIIDWTMVD